MKDYEIMLAQANHVEREKYTELVEKEVKEKYKTMGSEIAILRKAIKAIGGAKGVKLPQEFLDYYNEVEGIKTGIKESLNIL